MERQLAANILLVDDHPENLLAMEAVLESLGETIITAKSGEEALRQLLIHDFAVILLDVQMAGIDGFETARLIKQRTKSRHTPIIFVTAINRTDQHVFKGYDLGAVDYLFKPIVPEILKAKVAVFIELYRKNREVELQAQQINVINEELRQKLDSEQRLHDSLEKINDLYRVSRGVGSVRTIDAVFATLLTSDYLKIRDATLLLFDKPWQAEPPEFLRVAVAAGRTAKRSRHATYPLESYPFVPFLSSAAPVYVRNAQDEPRLPDAVRAALRDNEISDVALFPLCNASAWYGVLELRFGSEQPWGADTTRHLERLIDQALIAIDHLILLKSEAEARAAAERADQLKMRFLGMISHELRTPLTSIKGFTTTLLAEDVSWDDESEHNFLTIIDQEADKLTALIDQLLDLSKMHAGSLSISPIMADFAEVLDEAALHLNLLTANHRLVIDIADDLPPLEVDKHRVGQVIENLVGNAAKFSPENSEVRVIVTRDEDGIRVAVQDSGVGIPDDEQPQIFEAFHQVKRNQNSRGAGLGLAICKGLIEAHGGHIWLEQSSSSGTTIAFRLPALGSAPIEDSPFSTLSDSSI